MIETAGEVGLPDDRSFREAFVASAQWIKRPEAIGRCLNGPVRGTRPRVDVGAGQPAAARAGSI